LEKASKDVQGQDECLMQLFTEAGLVGGLPTATTGGEPPAAAAAESTATTLANAMLRKGILPRGEAPQVRTQITVYNGVMVMCCLLLRFPLLFRSLDVLM
jgi:hypothetical protein